MNHYLDLVMKVLTQGEKVSTRNGERLTIYGEQLRFDLTRDFPIVTTKKVPFRWVAGELCWFLDGDTDIKKLQEWKIPIWDANAGRDGYIGPSYGFQWRSYGVEYGVDQILQCINIIEMTSYSTRNIVMAWHPEQSHECALPPCHYAFQVHHSKDALRLHATMRSTDVMVGLPFNIASYALLAHLLAIRTKRKAVELIMSLADVHIYEGHVDNAYRQVRRQPCPLPTLLVQPNRITPDLRGMTPDIFALDNYVHHSKLEYEMYV